MGGGCPDRRTSPPKSTEGLPARVALQLPVGWEHGVWRQGMPGVPNLLLNELGEQIKGHEALFPRAGG